MRTQRQQQRTPGHQRGTPRQHPHRLRQVPPPHPHTAGTDPDLAAFARHPYDPFLTARASGHLLGAVLRHPPRRGWPRVAALLVACALLVGPVVTLGVIGGLLPLSTTEGHIAAGLRILLITGFPGLLGGVLLWRLLRR